MDKLDDRLRDNLPELPGVEYEVGREGADPTKELRINLEGPDFGELAASHSKCPSGRNGGDLGSFGPGEMVKEFDQVVFNEAVGQVHGPVRTQFGYHLLEITSRTD